MTLTVQHQGQHCIWLSSFLDMCVDSNILKMCDLEPDNMTKLADLCTMETAILDLCKWVCKNGASACVLLLNILYCPKLHSCQWKHLYYEVQVCIA